jgi:hypothetical protein
LGNRHQNKGFGPLGYMGLLLALILGHSSGALAGLRTVDVSPYAIGAPTVTDIYVSPTGSDANDGANRATPLQTIGAAWGMIPTGTLSGSGYRINLLPGSYPCEGDCINFFSSRHGTYAYPILLTAADGPGTVTLLGGLNLYDVHYLYLLDLTLRAGGDVGAAFGNNVLHIELGNHILMRGLTIQGPQSCIYDTCNDMQEVLKVNQSQYVYLEGSDLSGAMQTALDYFAVQYGHVLDSRIHYSGGRCAYVKGGSAYLVFARNEFDDCREAGLQIGEGSNLAFMGSPWLHYESYDIKAVNNVIHNIYGAGLSVVGSYNVLLAYNTLYRIGLDNPANGQTWPLAQFIHGSRGCTQADEWGGAAGTAARCQAQLDAGGWGTALLDGGDWIPNRNVRVYNNLFYNPPGSGTHYGHLVVNGPITPPAQTENIPSPSLADDHLEFRGNLIWNQPIEPVGLLGDNNGSGNIGCQPTNATCNETQLWAENAINLLQPQLVNPAAGDFHPAAGSNLFTLAPLTIPDFTWDDAPTTPAIPAGNCDNQVTRDADGQSRAPVNLIGAYVTVDGGDGCATQALILQDQTLGSGASYCSTQSITLGLGVTLSGTDIRCTAPLIRLLPRVHIASGSTVRLGD